jgi:hypothetical protein
MGSFLANARSRAHLAFFFLLLSLGSVDLASSQTSSPPKTVASPRSFDSTVVALRAQNAIIREYQQDLLTTVYWSLGGLGVIAGLLLGFGWFANFRIYERDKAALRQDILGVLREEVAKEHTMIAAALSKSDEHLRSRLDEISAAASEAAESAAKSVEGRLQMLREHIDRRLTDIELDVTELEADQWAAQKVFTNELRAAVKMVRLAQKLDQEWQISRGLDRVHQSLKSGADPDADLSRSVVAMLDSLPPSYSTEVDTLKSAVKSARSRID